jgi:hypothetical protein
MSITENLMTIAKVLIVLNEDISSRKSPVRAQGIKAENKH